MFEMKMNDFDVLLRFARVVNVTVNTKFILPPVKFKIYSLAFL